MELLNRGRDHTVCLIQMSLTAALFFPLQRSYPFLGGIIVEMLSPLPLAFVEAARPAGNVAIAPLQLAPLTAKGRGGSEGCGLVLLRVTIAPVIAMAWISLVLLSETLHMSLVIVGRKGPIRCIRGSMSKPRRG